VSTVRTATLVSAAAVCDALEESLTAYLPRVLDYLGWTDLGAVRTWHQVPRIEALTTADVPAGGIESPGLTGPPTKNSDGTYGCEWEVTAGVFARGSDYAATQSAGRRWPMALVAAALVDRSLGGKVSRTEWVGQDLARIRTRDAARTITLGAATFHVRVDTVLDPGDFRLPGLGPDVTTTDVQVTQSSPPGPLTT
jgi:hypothetical protein